MANEIVQNIPVLVAVNKSEMEGAAAAAEVRFFSKIEKKNRNSCIKIIFSRSECCSKTTITARTLQFFRFRR